MEPIVKWPFGDATVTPLTASGTQAVTIQNEMTIIDGVSVQATAARTINLTVEDSVGVGAIMLVKSKTAATEATNFGTGMQGKALVGVAGKTKTATFIYDGTNFVEAGADVQID
jgi:hypothetical protein